MKLSYQTNTWGGVVGYPAGVTSVKDLFYLAYGSTVQALHEIANLGFQGFELFDGNLMAYESRKDDFRSLLRETGLKFVAVYTGANFIFSDILPEELWRIQKTAVLAAEFGVEYIIIGGGALRATGRREDDFEKLAAGLSQVDELARCYGLTACYHPHHGTLIETPEEISRIMELVSIDLCPDTGHIQEAGGDPVKIIQTYGSRIPYIHLKDYGNSDFLPLGQGFVDIEGIILALNSIGYTGWITAELDTYSGPPKEAAEIAIRYLELITSSYIRSTQAG